MTTPQDPPPMLEAILRAAREKFPGQDWSMVEGHVRKAWNAMAHDAPWEDVREPASRTWQSINRPA